MLDLENLDIQALRKRAEQEAPDLTGSLEKLNQDEVIDQIVQKRNEEKNFNQSIRLYFLCLFLIFPMVVRTMIDANLCRKLNEQGDEWLMVDLDVSCDDSDYKDRMLWVFRAGALLYPLGVPLGLFMLLRHYRSKLRKQYGKRDGLERFKDRFEFLVGDYKDEYYYWDCIEMARKVVLAGILSILGPVQAALAGSSTTGAWAAPGSQFQLLVGIFTSTVFMVFVGQHKPFALKRNGVWCDTNGFKLWCDFCGTMMLVLSVMLKGSELSDERLSSESLGILMMLFAVYPFFREAMVRTRLLQRLRTYRHIFCNLCSSCALRRSSGCRPTEPHPALSSELSQLAEKGIVSVMFVKKDQGRHNQVFELNQNNGF